MKIRCRTREVGEAVNLVAGIVATNTTRPILQCVHLSASSDGLVVQGTDLDVAISVRVDEVDVAEPGHLAVQASRLHAILREAKSEDLVMALDTDGGHVKLRAGSSRFRIPCSDPTEFPELEFQPASPSLTASRGEFIDLLRKVSVAAAKDATRFQMHSVLFDSGDGKSEGGAAEGQWLRLVSTDGKRLALGTLNATAGGSGERAEGRFIVPIKGVDLLSRVLGGEATDSVEIHLNEKKLTFLSDRTSMTCNLVEGRYPDYKRAVPPSGGFVFDLPTDDLMTALRQVSLMTNKETNSVHFKFQGPRLELSSHAANLGESTVEVEVEPVETPEEEFEINFNPMYLIDMLKAHDSPKLRLSVKDRSTAGVFTILGQEEAYRHVVMPLVTSA